jgi:hypothetical protein
VANAERHTSLFKNKAITDNYVFVWTANYVHDLEGQKQAGTYRQPQGLGGLSQVAALALSDSTDMEEVRKWITY